MKQPPTPAKRENRRNTPGTTHQLATDKDCVSDTPHSYELFKLQETRSKPLVVTMKLNKAEVNMEVDIEASLSLISEKTLYSLWSSESRPKLEGSSVKLHTYIYQRVHQSIRLCSCGGYLQNSK